MIITNIFAGAKKVIRVYKGTNLVWESIRIANMFGDAEFSAYADGKIAFFTLLPAVGYSSSNSRGDGFATVYAIGLLPASGEVELNTNAAGSMTRWQLIPNAGQAEATTHSWGCFAEIPLIPFAGDGENHQYGKARALDAASRAGRSNVEISIPAEGIGRYFPRIGGNGDATIELFVDGRGMSYAVLHAKGGFTVNVNAYGKGLAAGELPVKGKNTNSTRGKGKLSAFPRAAYSGKSSAFTKARAIWDCFPLVRALGKGKTNTKAEGVATAWDVIRLLGDYDIKTEAAAGAKAMDASAMLGGEVITTAAEAAARVFTIVGMVSKAEHMVDAIAAMDYHWAAIMYAGEKSTTSAAGTVEFWYLPYVDGNVLDIRQAYNVIEDNDTLEVI